MQPTPVISIPTRDAHPVVADWYAPNGTDHGNVDRVIVMSHGFKGHRRWGFIPIVATRLQFKGFGVLAIDFSHNGHVPADGSVVEEVAEGFIAPELFRENTIARERDDLAHVLTWLRDPLGGTFLLGLTENAVIGLWGHSRGGVISILTALDDPGITALVTWSALAHPDHYTERQKELWRTKGELAFTDYASGTALALGEAYLDDIEAQRDAYAVGDRAQDLAIPHLIVHGEHDPTVPVADSYKFYDTPTIRADKKLLRLLTGHTYGYDEGRIASEALDNAIKATAEWFETYLTAPSAQESQGD
jgi:dienelactone hydrolase